MARRAAADLRIEPLDARHDRAGVTCGVESLDRYLKTQAGQDLRRKANAVFVMVGESEPSVVLGYVTLCATSLEQGDAPEAARKHIPRYPLVSATLLGRLAVSAARHGEGLGGILLGWALGKAYESASSVGSSMMVVDAIDVQAVGFYEAHGFIRFGDSLRLGMAMRTVGKLMDG